MVALHRIFQRRDVGRMFRNERGRILNQSKKQFRELNSQHAVEDHVGLGNGSFCAHVGLDDFRVARISAVVGLSWAGSDGRGNFGTHLSDGSHGSRTSEYGYERSLGLGTTCGQNGRRGGRHSFDHPLPYSTHPVD
jgi:hypothetical protein